MPARRSLTTICLALSLLLLVAIPAQAGCRLFDDSLVCPIGTELDGPQLGEGGGAGGGSAGPSVAPGVYPEGARRLLELANQERSSAGLAPLTSRPDLVSLALEHTFKLVNADALSHNLGLLERPLRGLLGASVVGENVGWSTDIDDLHSRLMASPLHRASILDPRFSVVGMAVVRSENGRFYATQDFAQPDGSAPAPVAPAEPAAPASGPRVTPVSEPAPPSTEPVETETDVAATPAEADSTPATPDGPDTARRPRPAGAVENLMPTQPVAADGPTATSGVVVLAIALAAAVALADGAWVVRDHRTARA